MTVTDIRTLQAKRGNSQKTNQTTQKTEMVGTNDSLSLDVHFDYKVHGDFVYLGVVFFEDGDSLHSTSTKFKVRGGNNFHNSISAFAFALESTRKYLLGEGENIYDMVTLFNQNSRVFEWTNSGEFDMSKYAKEAEDLFCAFADLQDVVDIGFDYKKIQGPKNAAKKLLDKKTKALPQSKVAVQPSDALKKKFAEAREKRRIAVQKAAAQSMSASHKNSSDISKTSQMN